jgi:CheY-like chemotaxis protein
MIMYDKKTEGSPHLLVAHSDTVLRQVLSQLLAKSGCQVEPVATAGECADHARRQHYQAVFIDDSVAGSTSCELLRTLRAVPGYESVPLVVTGMTEPVEGIRHLFSCGADRFLRTPFTRSHVQEILQLCKILPAQELV